MVNEQLPKSAERLALVYRLSQTFNSSLDLDLVLNQVMDEVIRAMNAERGFIMLIEPDAHLVFKVARGIEQETIADPAFQVSKGIVERVALGSNPVLTSDASNDQSLSMRDSVIHLGLRSVLCVPLQVKGNTIGVIYVDNRLRAGIFTEDDLDLLAAISGSAASAIENARLYGISLEKARIERELQVAYQVQASLLPKELPRIPGWEFVAFWKPARQVSGDFYDFIHFGDDSIGLVIGDVTDKGMPAALFMAFTRTIIRASLDPNKTPADSISQANRLICSESTYGFFVTLFFAALNTKTGELIYVNGGHNPPLLFQNRQHDPVWLENTGMVLGIEPEIEYAQKNVSLKPGELVLLYTDGILDALDNQSEAFGLERLQNIISENYREPAHEIIRRIEQSVEVFVGGVPQYDDMTLLLVKRL
jgi:phosphoserine phosphatase RsbU/P